MIEVRRATPADIEACTTVLTQSFLDDPGTIVIEPDRARRLAILPAFFRTFVTAAIADGGDLVVPSASVNGLASWFGPDAFGPSEEAMGAAGFGDVIARFGPEASGRMIAMVGELEAQHGQRMRGPHFRLEFFGVDPDAQGRGIGSALADHGHRRADALGLPCWLETFTQRNVEFYARRGYQVIATYPVGDGIPVYGMCRDPHPNRSGQVSARLGR